MNTSALKRFALKHRVLLSAYRASFGRIKTSLYFGLQRNALQKHGMAIIRDVHAALKPEGVSFFVDSGTLLGLIRDGSLIKGDRDIDFGIHPNDRFGETQLDNAMRALRFKKVRSFYYQGSWEESTYRSGLLHIDFFRHHETDNGSVCYAFHRDETHKYPSVNHFSVMKFCHAPVTEVVAIQIKGSEINVPFDAEGYLESAYTEDWRTPNPNWRYDMNPGFMGILNEFGLQKRY